MVHPLSTIHKLSNVECAIHKAGVPLDLSTEMLEENPGMTEECLLLMFDAVYETNRQLANALLKVRKAEQGKVILSETYTKPSSILK